MTKHRSSIPEATAFTPPPAIALNRARPAEPEETPRAAPRASETKAAPNKASAAPKVSMRKRLAALLALIAVPAMAAPGGFGAMPGDAPAEPVARETASGFEAAMAFEKPGMSFPGSAFYYLADPPKDALIALPESDPHIRAARDGREVGSLIDAGPAARAFFAGGGANGLRAQDCLAQAIWYEAASESEAGQRAVAQVVLNRVAHPSWPASVCGVVYEGSSRSTGCQFTFTCDGSLARRSPGSLRGASWTRAQELAREALSGSVYAPIGHATHYHTLWVNPYWAKTLDLVGVIGAHRFYRNRGRAGEKAAFTAAYAGAEPSVAPGAATRPVAPQSETLANAALGEVPQADRSVSAPVANPPALEQASGVSSAKPAHAKSGQPRAEFARSGQWKVDPARLGRGTKPAAEPNAKPAPDDTPAPTQAAPTEAAAPTDGR